MSWIVGDGQTIRIWKDPWLPHGSLRSYIEGPLIFHDEERRVSSLRTNHSWNFDEFDFPLPPSSKILFRGSLSRNLCDFQILFCGPTTMVLVQLNLLPNFSSINNTYSSINKVGIGFGIYNAQKRFKLSSGKLCATGCPQKHFSPLDAPISMLNGLSVTPRKQPFIYYVIVLGLKRSGINPQESCLCLSFSCHCKIGSKVMQLQTRLSHSSVQDAIEFHFLAGSASQTMVRIPQSILQNSELGISI